MLPSSVKKPAKKTGRARKKNQNRTSEEKTGPKNRNCPAKKIIRFREKNGDKKPAKKTG
jgi:hypothetical protein